MIVLLSATPERTFDNPRHTASAAWAARRELDWTASFVPEAFSLDSPPHLHQAVVTFSGQLVQIVLQVRSSEADAALAEARTILGLAPLPDAPKLPRVAPGTGFNSRRNIHKLRADQVIGPMPLRWPVGKRITSYSHNLGSYGQGGIGLSGWQFDEGSWMVLPLAHSDSWIWLSHETITRDLDKIVVSIDQRVIGCHPDQRSEFHPWEHRYGTADTIEDLPDFKDLRPVITEFRAGGSSFFLEAGSSGDSWRFEMGDHLARPIMAGSKEQRLLTQDESIIDSFVLTHSPYLDI